MKILHFADLHLGKDLHGFPLLEEQAHILKEIIEIARQEQVAAVLLAGDVYDRSNPPQEAIRLLGKFFTALREAKITLFLIAGNHDSVTRLGFGAEFFSLADLHLATEAQPEIKVHEFAAGGEKADIYLLPYTRRVDLKKFYPHLAEQDCYTDLMRAQLEPLRERVVVRRAEGIPAIIIAHQWLLNHAGESRVSESEETLLGMVEQLPASLFSFFDYVALGHLHRPQQIAENTYYSGSPLAYSASEAGQQKQVNILEIKSGEIKVHTQTLKPLHPVRKLQGSFEEVLNHPDESLKDAYLYIDLNDITVVQDARKKLEQRYPLLCDIRFTAYQGLSSSSFAQEIKQLRENPEVIFREFFREFTEHEASKQQEELIHHFLQDDEED